MVLQALIHNLPNINDTKDHVDTPLLFGYINVIAVASDNITSVFSNEKSIDKSIPIDISILSINSTTINSSKSFDLNLTGNGLNNINMVRLYYIDIINHNDNQAISKSISYNIETNELIASFDPITNIESLGNYNISLIISNMEIGIGPEFSVTLIN